MSCPTASSRRSSLKAGRAGVSGMTRLLGDAFTIERHALEPRIDPLPDNPHIADPVPRARRR
jgi:hypothetical protein